MKKTLLFTIVLLLSFAANTFSQEYRVMNNSRWIIENTNSQFPLPNPVRVIMEGTDEIVGDYSYKKYNDPFPQYDSNSNLVNTVYLREDAITKKVYKIVEGVDTLLYDFNLETGDVIFQYGNTFTATVDNIILNDGSSRKRITLVSTEQYCGFALQQIWIEGVGSNKHPFYPDNNIYTECSSSGGTTIFTNCSFQNGEHVYGEADCPEVMESLLGLNEPVAVDSQFSFSPNPFNTELTIQSDTPFTDATIQLYNVVGQLVRESHRQSGNKLIINRDQLDNGLYFIQLYEKGKWVTTAKIIAN